MINSAQGVGWALSACYNPDLQTYLLVTEHTTTNAGSLRFYKSPTPWGPWTILKSITNIHTQLGSTDNRIFYGSFSPKWFSNNGQNFVLIWTGTDANDSWNTTEGSFVIEAGPPPPDDASHRLMLVAHSFDNQLLNAPMVRFFLTAHPEFVKDGDFWMLVSGNFFGDPNPSAIDTVANALLDRFPNTTAIATISGMADVKRLADELNETRIRGIMNIWEPGCCPQPACANQGGNTGTPQFPVVEWCTRNQTNLNIIRQSTRNFINEAAPYCRARGWEFWFKPSGRSAFQPSGQVNGQPMIDYGEIGDLCDGQNIQLQGCVPDREDIAINHCLNRYELFNVDGGINGKPMFLQISLGGSGTNGTPVNQAFPFIQKVWAEIPNVAGGTMWWAGGQPQHAIDFLNRRNNL